MTRLERIIAQHAQARLTGETPVSAGDVEALLDVVRATEAVSQRWNSDPSYASSPVCQAMERAVQALREEGG